MMEICKGCKWCSDRRVRGRTEYESHCTYPYHGPHLDIPHPSWYTIKMEVCARRKEEKNESS